MPLSLKHVCNIRVSLKNVFVTLGLIAFVSNLIHSLLILSSYVV